MFCSCFPLTDVVKSISIYFYLLLSPTACDAELTSVTGAYAVTSNSNNDVANI